MKHILYIGFVTSNDDALKFQTSFAGNDAELKFVTKVLTKIADEKNIKICSYSYNIYNRESEIISSPKEFKINLDSKIKCYGIMILHIKILRQLLAFFSILAFLIKEVRKLNKDSIENKDILIVTCNTYPLFSVPAIIVCKIFKIPIATYLIDGFYNLDHKNIFIRNYSKLASALLKKYQYVITLCEKIIEDFCVSSQKTISITPIDLFPLEYLSLKSNNKFKLFFAGGIAPLNGIREYIDLMKYLNNDYELYIYGRGELLNFLIENTKKDNRIHYGGVLSKDEIMQLESSSNILLIIRPMISENQNNITKYGIPYKLLEYLQSGTPIVATEMDAIPHYLKGFINYSSSNPKDIAMKIEEINMNYNYYLEIAEKAKRYMESECTWDKYGMKLKYFFGESIE